MASRSSRSNRSSSQKSRSSAGAGKPLDPPKNANGAATNGSSKGATGNGASKGTTSGATFKEPNANGTTPGEAPPKGIANGTAHGVTTNGTATKNGARAPRESLREPDGAVEEKLPRHSSVAFGQGMTDEKAARDESQFWVIATVLLALGIALRQWQLEAFPYHPDEAIHAWYSDDFRNYRYDPTYHGPLLYHLVGAIMTVAGSNDYTARLVPSLLGVGALALVIGPARKYLGERGALWSMALLAISPVMVTYSRRILHDSLAVFLTLGAVLCFQTTREYSSSTKSGGLARIGVILTLTLFLCTKANVFFVIAMLFAFWLAERIKPYWSFRPFKGWHYVPIAALVLVAVPSHFTFLDKDKDSIAVTSAQFAMTGGGFTLFCVFACGLVGLWLLSGPRIEQQTDSTKPLTPQTLNQEPGAIATGIGVAKGVTRGTFAAWPYAVGLFVAFWVFTFLYGRGWEWFAGNFHLRESIAAAFAPGDLHSRDILPEDGALTKMVKYWGGQQATPRLPGPHDYYIYLLALYELPILLLSLAGIWRACRERTPFTDLLVWWTVTSFALYSLANEKVPWLMTHMILPMALLGGWWLARTFDDVAQKRVTPGMRSALVAGLAVGAVYLLRGVSACNFEAAANNHEPMFYAQDTEMFQDELKRALKDTEKLPNLQTKGIWVDAGSYNGSTKVEWANATWPCAWYLREGAFILRGSPVYWDNKANGDTRVAITSEERWALVKNQPMFKGWKTSTTEFFIWPRANFPALAPPTWFNFWLKRQVNPGNSADGLLASPGEWSSNKVLIATPPDASGR